MNDNHKVSFPPSPEKINKEATKNTCKFCQWYTLNINNGIVLKHGPCRGWGMVECESRTDSDSNPHSNYPHIIHHEYDWPTVKGNAPKCFHFDLKEEFE